MVAVNIFSILKMILNKKTIDPPLLKEEKLLLLEIREHIANDKSEVLLSELYEESLKNIVN
jgi:hypothetical protein